MVGDTIDEVAWIAVRRALADTCSWPAGIGFLS